MLLVSLPGRPAGAISGYRSFILFWYAKGTVP